MKYYAQPDLMTQQKENINTNRECQTVNFLERYFFRRLKVANHVDSDLQITELMSIINDKREAIMKYLNENKNDEIMASIASDFSIYTNTLEQYILIKRLESGVSTLIFFIYSILGNTAGVIMSILVFISTRGYVGHLILIISIMGGIAGIIIGMTSMRKERKFIESLREGI